MSLCFYNSDLVLGSLGIEIAKTLSLNYSNQETSVTVGESVRDEDGMYPKHTVSYLP
jgi:phosphoribosylpyrophosphate synthetase